VRRRVEQACQNNLKNLGLAAIGFESRKQRFPGAQELLLPQSANPKPASWMALLLEDLDRSDLAELWNNAGIPFSAVLTPSLEFATCPSSPDSLWVGATSYVANAGFVPRSVDPAPINGMSLGWPYAQRPANGVFMDRISNLKAQVTGSDMRDGMSNTLLMSENLLATSWWSVGPLDPYETAFLPITGFENVVEGARFGNTFVWLYVCEHPLTVSIVPRPEPQMKINGQRSNYPPGYPLPVVPEIARPSSYHPGGVNVVMGDGTTRFLADGVAYHVVQQLATPQGINSDMPAKSVYVLNTDDF
jgi:prepilin-type processing-associated H-X9-DG protein